MAHLRTELSANSTHCNLRLHGEFDLAAVAAVEAVLDDAARAGGDLYIDCTDVTFLDAAAIRVVEKACDNYSIRGRRCVLVHCHGIALRLLEICGLEHLLDDNASTP